MKQYAVILFSLFFLICSPYPPRMIFEPMKMEIEKMPDAWQGEPVIILNDSTVIKVVNRKDRNEVLSTMVRYYYINKQQPALIDRLSIRELVNCETTPYINAQALYPDGTFWQSTGGDVTRIPCFVQGVYSSDDFYHILTLPRYIAGTIVRLEITRTFTAPEHLGAEYLRDSYPIMKKVIKFLYPLNYEIVHTVSNGEQIPFQQTVTTEDQYKTVTITANLLKKLQEDNRLKHPEGWYAGFHCSVPPVGSRSYSWKELGDYSLLFINPALCTSQKIKDIAASVTTTETDSIIAGIFHTLQTRIRYFANFEDAHAFIPRPACEIVDKGYGDCKEMATVLKTVLRERNITVYPALVVTEGIAQCLDEVPTASTFNHMIICYERPDGSVHFYDPTISYGNAANSYFHLIGQKAFVIKEGQSRLVVIEKGPHYRNEIVTHSKISKPSDGERWQIAGIVSLRGFAAYNMFPYFQGLKGEEVSPYLTKFFKETFNLNVLSSGIKAISSDYVDIEYTANFQKSYLAMEKGGVLLDMPSLFGGDVRYTTLDYEGPRHFIGYRQTDEWELPDRFTNLENEVLDHWLASGAYSQKGKLVRRTYAQNDTNITEAGREKVREFYKNKLRFTQATVWKK